MDTLPTISREQWEAMKTAPAEMIWQLCNSYRNIIQEDKTGTAQQHFTTEQNMLLGFEAWDGQVSNGGIIQLIENGYGAFIFETPVGELLRTWGLVHTASIIDRARPLYSTNKAELEREKTLQEFALMYQQHPEFEPLDNEYYAICDAERERVATYVAAHVDSFVAIR